MRKIIILTALILFSACTPVGKSLEISNIIDVGDEPIGRSVYGNETVRVGIFDDQRPQSAVAIMNDDVIQPAGNVAATVRSAFEELMRQQGFRLGQFEGPSIGGEIVEWLVNVNTGFLKSNCEAKAAVKLYVKDANDRVRYQALYTGQAHNSQPVVKERNIEEALGEAMRSALQAAMDDQGLVKTLGSIQ